jgi:hypothetical protein
MHVCVCVCVCVYISSTLRMAPFLAIPIEQWVREPNKKHMFARETRARHTVREWRVCRTVRTGARVRVLDSKRARTVVEGGGGGGTSHYRGYCIEDQ